MFAAQKEWMAARWMAARKGELQKDEHGYAASAMAGTIIGVVVTIVVATALIATVANQTYLASQNASFKTFTGATGLLPLLVLFFTIGVVILPIALVFVALQHET